MKTYYIGLNKSDILMSALFIVVFFGLIYKGLHTLPHNCTFSEHHKLFS